MAKSFSKIFLSTVAKSNLGAHQHFSSVFDFAHDTLEHFVAETGITWEAWFGGTDLVVPIVEASAKYTKEIFSGKEIEVKLSVQRLGKTSVTINYSFTQEGRSCCVVTLIHVFVDRPARRPTQIPSAIKSVLEGYLQASD